MNKYITSVMLCSILVLGCGHSKLIKTQLFTGPDGSSRWVSIQCKEGIADCLSKAGNICPTGYAVVDKDSIGGSMSETQFGNSNNVFGNSKIATYSNKNELIIKCKQTPIFQDEDAEDGNGVWSAYK